ncbi:MAG: PaaI family thioesterase [Candidatus Bathyarchaeia archaeon]|jgi:acyl-CoA thioesterase
MTKSSRRMIWIRQLAREMPFYNHLGMHLTRLGTGRAEIRINVTRRLTQDAGVAHGGVAAALIDSAVGLALYTMLDAEEFITTVELKVNFTAPAQLGLLKASGQIIHKGKRIAVGEAEVKDQKKRLIAKGLVTYIIMKK